MLRLVANVRFLAVACLTSLSLSFSPAAQAQMTPVLAVVDMDLVVRESNAVRTLEAQLLELQTRWEGELTEVNQQLAATLRAAQEKLNAGEIEQAHLPEPTAAPYPVGNRRVNHQQPKR